MEIGKLRKVLASFERNHGKLYANVDVHVQGEDITYNAKAAAIVDGARLNIVNVDCEPADWNPAHNAPHLAMPESPQLHTTLKTTNY